MPRTAFQKWVFGILMALAMVYGMEAYNAVLRNGGLSKGCFRVSASELLLLGLTVILLERRIAGPVAWKLARMAAPRMLQPPAAPTLVLPFFMVCCMCPLMSLVAVLAFKGITRGMMAKWALTVAFNFPMALCWQILIAGPLVRFLFQCLFPTRIQKVIPS